MTRLMPAVEEGARGTFSKEQEGMQNVGRSHGAKGRQSDWSLPVFITESTSHDPGPPSGSPDRTRETRPVRGIQTIYDLTWHISYDRVQELRTEEEMWFRAWDQPAELCISGR